MWGTYLQCPRRVTPINRVRLLACGAAGKVHLNRQIFMATANDLRRGMAINYNGDICVVLEFQHRTPGNLRAFVQATLRSIRTGKSSDILRTVIDELDVLAADQ